MDISRFDFDLPPHLIAQEPAARRDDSRLMLVNRESGEIGHHQFRELPNLLPSDSLLVLNNTEVFPAKLVGDCDGRRLEVLLVRQIEADIWEVLVRPGKRARVGNKVSFCNGNLRGEFLERLPGERPRIILHSTRDVWELLEEFGQSPLPPYIKRPRKDPSPQLDRRRYQTIYASRRGSIAAPTAGLHFTENLLASLDDFCFLTLHVGYGTFKPIRTTAVEEHQMESEWYELDPAAAARIEAQRLLGNPIVSVGSTSTRVLETLMLKEGSIVPSSDWTDLFIYPGFQFKIVSALLTNFHLPKSTLYLLTSSFAGTELLRLCYAEAIRKRYRFYSYGDAMLIL